MRHAECCKRDGFQKCSIFVWRYTNWQNVYLEIVAILIHIIQLEDFGRTDITSSSIQQENMALCDNSSDMIILICTSSLERKKTKTNFKLFRRQEVPKYHKVHSALYYCTIFVSWQGYWRYPNSRQIHYCHIMIKMFSLIFVF